MVRRYYDLPSLTALAVFESSARHLSFKLAATELNVTPGAVSRQIKAVEEEIGVPLFVRLRTGVTLTNAGEDLYAVLASGFSRASEVFRSVKRGDSSKNVTIACSDSIASMWLMPRMPGFWKRHPEIAVDHIISDNTRDYRRSEVELRIRYGFGSWPDESAELLFNDTIYPVCGAGFAQEHRDVTVQSLPELRLLHFNCGDPDWIGWDEVFRRAAVPHGSFRGCRFGKLSVTMQAAEADQGVAVGWHRLVLPLIKEGKLARITDLELPSPGGYYLTWNDNRTLSPAAELFQKWLREVAAQEQGTDC